MTNTIKLIVGLGNIGSEYENTRHNAGKWFVDELLKKNNMDFTSETKFNSHIAKLDIQGHKLILIFPTTYMNNSGTAVAKVCNFYKIKPEEILVAHDELDLSCDQIRLKKGGGHGGHNGLRDIKDSLGTSDFWRLRIGINHPGTKSKVVSHVLSSPTSDEKISIDCTISQAIENINTIINGDFEKAMNILNLRK